MCIPERACSTSSCQLSIEFLHIISLISQIHYMMHIPVCLPNSFLVKQHFGCLYTWTTKAPAMYILPLAGKWYKFDQIIACYCYSLVHYWFAADEYYWKLICPSPCLQVAGILIAIQLCAYISVMFIADISDEDVKYYVYSKYSINYWLNED